MAAPLLRRVRVLAASIEAEPGTAESLDATDAAFNVFDPKIQQGFEMAEREQQGGFGLLPASPGGRLGTVTFSIELTAPGVQPGWAAVFLPGCGMGFSATKYLLDTIPPEGAGSTQETLTIAVYENGLRKSIYGAMGSVRFTFTAGKRAMAEFTFTGIWAPPTDVAILAPNYPTDPPLRFETSALAVGAWTPAVQELSLDLGNEVYVREDSTKAAGYSSACIAMRKVTGSINPEAGLVATKNIYGEHLASTEASLSFVCRSGNDSATFSATKLQWMNPQEAERNGIQSDDIGFNLNADDLQVIFDTAASTTVAP